MQMTNTSALLGLGTLVIIFAFLVSLVRLRRQNVELQHAIFKLNNEFRAMNNGHIGMGRKISQVVAELTSSENQLREIPTDATSAKTYQQASLLLARGASIEEVVESCEISPAEAELLAIVCHAAPSHTSRKANASDSGVSQSSRKPARHLA